MVPDSASSTAFGRVRVNARSVLSSVDSEDSRQESAHHGFRSVDQQIHDVLSGWWGLGSRVFGGRWGNTNGSVTGVFDSWSERNGNTRDAMDEYRDQDDGSADEFESANADISALMARFNF